MTFTQTSVSLFCFPTKPKIFILTTVMPCKSGKGGGEKRKQANDKQFPRVSGKKMEAIKIILDNNSMNCTASVRAWAKSKQTDLSIAAWEKNQKFTKTAETPPQRNDLLLSTHSRVSVPLY